MSSSNDALVNKVENERADVLRVELARLCWLAIHDTAHGVNESDMLKTLEIARAARQSIPARKSQTSKAEAFAQSESGGG